MPPDYQTIARLEPDETFTIWPAGEAPGAHTSPAHYVLTERSTLASLPDRAATGIRAPLISAWRPKEPNGVALLVAPGGGYNRVVVDKEGSDLAARFTAQGYTLFVMTYRMPDGGHSEASLAPLADIQRAIRVIRTRSPAWGLNAQRIGVLGFSAGGHLAGSLATHFDYPAYPAMDEADSLSARPDFAALMYPVITMDAALTHPGSARALLGATPEPLWRQHHSLELQVRDDMPPVFLAHAADDPSVPVANSLLMFQALLAHKVPAEMHIFQQGQHGFGIRGCLDLPAQSWPELLMNWVEAQYP
ncbi:alpha/beta hydrolase [Mangrovibacter plantisponsor]|uniref:Acetyl esterase/lipase n=1 Tax=Mangrovibacter plantisponsor TaxID=451513 RepID=A0A317Q8X6_9ENTR|nr:alpha/beta hydrolase [Mangrovibacter plantisponsor]PWW10786.1 acetyl esterase/lipase [Mangrovibacter plantisponsor]